MPVDMLKKEQRTISMVTHQRTEERKKKIIILFHTVNIDRTICIKIIKKLLVKKYLINTNDV